MCSVPSATMRRPAERVRHTRLSSPPLPSNGTINDILLFPGRSSDEHSLRCEVKLLANMVCGGLKAPKKPDFYLPASGNEEKAHPLK